MDRGDGALKHACRAEVGVAECGVCSVGEVCNLELLLEFYGDRRCWGREGLEDGVVDGCGARNTDSAACPARIESSVKNFKHGRFGAYGHFILDKARDPGLSSRENDFIVEFGTVDEIVRVFWSM